MGKVMTGVIATQRWLSLGIILLVGMIGGSMTAQAENGRDFAGFLSVTDVVGGTEEVTLSISLEIVNYSGVDVTNATLRIEQGFPPSTLYEFPTPIDIAYRSRTVLTAPVLVIPRQQYMQWANGTLPRLSLTFTQGSNNPRSSVVELVPMVVDREIQP